MPAKEMSDLELSYGAIRNQNPDNVYLATKRKCKMLAFITQVEEWKDEDDNDTSMTDIYQRQMKEIMKALQKKKEKEKLRKQKWGKLNIVWKHNEDVYIKAVKPQTCFEQLKVKRKPVRPKGLQIQIHHLKINTSEKTSMKPQSSSSRSNGSTIEEATFKSGQRVFSISGSIQGSKDQEIRFWNEDSGESSALPILKTSIKASSPIERSQGFKSKKCHVKRDSRTLFMTRKDTGNRAKDMFSCRPLDREQSAFGDLKTPESMTLHKSVTREPKKSVSFDSAFKVFQKHQTEAKCHVALNQLIPDLDDIIPSELLVKAFVSEQLLNLNLEGSKADKIRQLYIAAIIKSPIVTNFILRHPEILSTKIFKELIAFKKKSENHPTFAARKSFHEMDDWRAFYISSLTPPSGTVLIELEHDMPLYANFYKTLIARRGESVEINKELVKETKKSAIRDMILHKTIQLRMARTTPDSPVRLEMMSIMATAAYNDVLLNLLVQTIDSWLDQLTKSLFSPYNSVREETCQVLCFMIGSYTIMKALYLSRYFDVVYDLTSTLFRAMETYDDTFENYYITLAHLINYCPSRGFLDCLIERHLSFKAPVLIRMWPQLMYYAFRYWPNDPLCVKSTIFGKKVVSLLEAAIQKPLTAKFARHALYYVQLRQKNVSRIFSIHTDKGEVAHFLKRGF